MATLIARWLVPSQGGVTITIYPQTVDGTGLFTAGSAVVLAGHLVSLERSNNRQTVEKHPMDSGSANHIRKLDDVIWTITEIVRDQTGAGSPVASLLKATYYGGSYVEGVAVVGGNTETFYGIWGNYRETLNDEGGQFEAEILQSGLTTANPTYA